MSDVIHQGAPRRVGYIDPEVVQRLLKASDIATVFVAMLTLALMASDFARPGREATAAFLALVGAFAAVLVMRRLRLYTVEALLHPLAGVLAGGLATVAIGLALAAVAGLFAITFSPTWPLFWFAAVFAHMAVSRTAAALWMRPRAAAGAFRKRIAIVGGGKAAEDAIKALETSSDLDIEVVGLFDDRFDKRSPAAIKRHRKVGKIADLADFARRQRVDLIIVAIPLSAEARLLQMLKRLWELPVDIRISGEASQLKLSPSAYTMLGKLPLLAVFDRPLSSWGSLIKDTMDRVLAGIFIVLLSPLMLATAIAIKATSKGPVIFRQKRYGFNNELIEVFKFRSMYTDMSDADAARLVTRDDPRVTPLGRFIRKTSIDELPQLFNVLRGELSLVGPRPHATQAKAADRLYDQVVEGYFARHKVKPGITGWAQINGWRGETNTAEKIKNRVACDLEYINRWSLGFDLYIIARTPFALLRGENAY